MACLCTIIRACGIKEQGNKVSWGGVGCYDHDQISRPNMLLTCVHTGEECQMNLPTHPRPSAVANTVRQWEIAWSQVLLFVFMEKGG
jgi:hypothetical protein